MSNLSLKDIEKSKNIEMLYKQDYFDTKKKVNRSEKEIDLKMLETIENGITSEQLDAFKVPVFRYGTQITIHGLFPNIEQSLRIGGYKRIFQNKNKSVGVKYEAIDNEKKKRIYRALQHVHGFSIRNDSKEYTAYLAIRCKNREEVMQKIEEHRPLFDKINLQYGNKQLYYAVVPYFGHIFHYMVLSVYIYAIYEKNISRFMQDVCGKTEAEIKAEIKVKNDKDETERDARLKRWKEEEKIEKEKEKTILDAELLRLSSLGIQIECNIPITEGLVIMSVKAETSYSSKDQKLKYRITHYYKPHRARLFNYNDRTFENYNDALKYAPMKETSFNDSKVRKDTTSGIIISQ